MMNGEFNDEITALCFDKNQTRMFIGDSTGMIKTLDAITGICIHKFEPLSSEVVCLYYNHLDKTLLAVGKNCEVKIYKDFKKIAQGERELLRTVKHVHKKEILSADYHIEKNVFAIGSADGYIKIWQE